MRCHNRAQNFVEYTLVLGIAALALFSMQAYFKRGIQATIKVVADDLGPQGEPIAIRFKSNPQAYEQMVADQRKIEAATKEKYYPDGDKYVYTSASSEEVKIENKGKGNIVRTTNRGVASSDDVSYR